MSHYATLGVPRDADDATIKRAYRRKSSKAHPDRAGGNHQAMVALTRAYETLSNPGKRSRYDQTGDDTQVPPSTDVKARSMIMQLFMAAMERLPATANLIDVVRQQLTLNQHQMRTSAAELLTKIGRAEARRKRLKCKKGRADFLTDLLDQQIRAWRAMATQAEEDAREVVPRALQMIDDYSYEPEKMAAAFESVIFTINITG